MNVVICGQTTPTLGVSLNQVGASPVLPPACPLFRVCLPPDVLFMKTALTTQAPVDPPLSELLVRTWLSAGFYSFLGDLPSVSHEF